METIPPAVIETCRPVAAGTTCARTKTAPAASRIEIKTAPNRLICNMCFQSGQIFAAGGESSEQNQSKYALFESLRGGFFLKKKPLEDIASRYSNSGFAIVERVQELLDRNATQVRFRSGVSR
jgi:hypothetical protein